MRVLVILVVTFILSVFGASDKKPHIHNGVLVPYEAKHLSFALTVKDIEMLDRGSPVVMKELEGKSGRGIVVQDIHAPPAVCMKMLLDLSSYHKMVPNVKSVEPYNVVKHENGTIETDAKFNIRISLLSFAYFLHLTYRPELFTISWTLDYKYSSDFDDNTGHWQVMPHPSKSGWSRVLFSTEAKVFPWVPQIVVNFLTNTALVESTTWLKRESEKYASLSSNDVFAEDSNTKLLGCYIEQSTGVSYTFPCSSRLSSSSSSQEL